MDDRDRLQGVFRDVFDDPGLKLSDDLSVDTLEGWDSVAMVQVVLGTEEEFGVRFTTGEVASIRAVPDILQLLREHRAG